MKTLLISATLATLALTGVASAATQADINKIERYSAGQDASNLTDAQVKSLLAAIHSGDSAGEITRTVQAVVGASNNG